MLVAGLAATLFAFPAQAQVPPQSNAPSAAEEPQWLSSTSVAALQALDKITGHVRRIDAPVGQTVQFGTLDILVQTCRKHPPDEPPESAAFLEITDVKPGETAKRLFTGWMFASSPAVSAMEDPVYDVWVVDCKGNPVAGQAQGQPQK